jgi:predicted TIM-barrel fold metal-dependent hydrolase
MDDTTISFVKKQLAHLRADWNRLVVDADTHITDMSSVPPDAQQRMATTQNYYHGRPISAELLLAEMDLAEVDMALSWQNPATTPYGTDPSQNYDTLLAANRYVVESARQHPARIIPAAWTDPQALGVRRAVELAQHCVNDLGVALVKMNPAQNEFPLNGPEASEVAEAIIDTGAMVAFHFGADTEYTPAEALADVASRYPQSTFIGVHMGGGGASYLEAEELYHESRQIGLEHENIHFVVSAKRDTHIESDFIVYQMAGSPYRENISCGSDAPYGKVAFHFAGYRALLGGFLRADKHPDPRVRENPELFDEQSIQGFLGGNLARLFIRAYERLLSRQEASAG